jgi:hypothetical protein
MCHDTSTTCADCRLQRKRQANKDRQARQRAANHYAEVEMPLLDCTERADWIERRLAAIDAERRRLHSGSRC